MLLPAILFSMFYYVASEIKMQKQASRIQYNRIKFKSGCNIPSPTEIIQNSRISMPIFTGNSIVTPETNCGKNRDDPPQLIDTCLSDLLDPYGCLPGTSVNFQKHNFVGNISIMVISMFKNMSFSNDIFYSVLSGPELVPSKTTNTGHGVTHLSFDVRVPGTYLLRVILVHRGFHAHDDTPKSEASIWKNVIGSPFMINIGGPHLPAFSNLTSLPSCHFMSLATYGRWVHSSLLKDWTDLVDDIVDDYVWVPYYCRIIRSTSLARSLVRNGIKIIRFCGDSYARTAAVVLLDVLYGQQGEGYTLNTALNKYNARNRAESLNYTLMRDNEYVEVQYVDMALGQITDCINANLNKPSLIHVNYGAWQADGADGASSRFEMFQIKMSETAKVIQKYSSEMHFIWATIHPFSHEFFKSRTRTNQRIQIMNYISTYEMVHVAKVDVFDAYGMAYPRLDTVCDEGSHFHCLRSNKTRGGRLGLWELHVFSNVLAQPRRNQDGR